MESAAAPHTPQGPALVVRLHVDLCRCASATCRP
ncbi:MULTISPECIES: putative leader peptide [unclassified Streptomyces]|nr:putative leader peptide [Streptomyces sp. SHP 1-2]